MADSFGGHIRIVGGRHDLEGRIAAEDVAECSPYGGGIVDDKHFDLVGSRSGFDHIACPQFFWKIAGATCLRAKPVPTIDSECPNNR